MLLKLEETSPSRGMGGAGSLFPASASAPAAGGRRRRARAARGQLALLRPLLGGGRGRRGVGLRLVAGHLQGAGRGTAFFLRRGVGCALCGGLIGLWIALDVTSRHQTFKLSTFKHSNIKHSKLSPLPSPFSSLCDWHPEGRRLAKGRRPQSVLCFPGRGFYHRTIHPGFFGLLHLDMCHAEKDTFVIIFF